MAGKVKSTKPKIKVEEIEEPEIEEEVADEPTPKAPQDSTIQETKETKLDEGGSAGEVEKEKEAPKEEKTEEVEEKRSILEPPKVASFSQLDTPPSPAQASKAAEEIPAKVSEPDRTWEKEEAEAQKVSESESKEEKSDASSNEIKEWLKEVRPDTSKEVEKANRPNTKFVLIMVVALLILGAIVGGFFYYRQSVSEPVMEEVVEEITATTTPTPTEAPEVDLQTFKVSVLNGSGITGEAGRVKALLSEGDGGFAADNVTAGNADSSDYEETEVQLKADTPEAVFDAINEILGDTYTVVKSDEALGEDSGYDVVVIVGTKKSS